MNATRDEKEKFLSGDCVSFAKSYIENIDKDAELVTLFESGVAIHCLVYSSNGKYIDVTGEYDSEYEYIENIVPVLNDVLDDEYSDDMCIYHKDGTHEFFPENESAKKEALEILNRK